MLSFNLLVAVVATMSVDAASLIPRPDLLPARAVLPNPYPMPGTPYSIDFVNPAVQPPPLVAADVDYAISFIREKEETASKQHRDSPMGARSFDFGNLDLAVNFTITSTPPPGSEGMTCNDIFPILDAFSLKMKEEGYRQRFGNITVTDTGVGLGNAVLFPQPPPNGKDKIKNKVLLLNPAVNPYPLPDSDLSIEFDEPGEALLREDVTQSIILFRRKLNQYIQQHGEGPIPRRLMYSWRSVEFEIFSMPAYDRVTLKNTLDILDAFAMRSAKEEYRSLKGDIIMTEQRERPGVLAQALLGPSGREHLNSPKTIES
ncbi:MAG: hypothetical protein Q9166_001458 [cf. Caloplaca sp. 2 TL-2023]